MDDLIKGGLQINCRYVCGILLNIRIPSEYIHTYMYMYICILSYVFATYVQMLCVMCFIENFKLQKLIQKLFQICMLLLIFIKKITDTCYIFIHVCMQISIIMSIYIIEYNL